MRQNEMKVYESLRYSSKLMNNKIFFVKTFTFVHLGCTLLTFAFAVSDFKIRLQNFSFAWTILKF